MERLCGGNQKKKNSLLARKIISLQRIPLLKISNAFHTVPNISLPILCNIMPIKITLNIEVSVFNLFQAKIPAHFYKWKVLPSEINYPIDIWNTHPSTKI